MLLYIFYNEKSSLESSSQRALSYFGNVHGQLHGILIDLFAYSQCIYNSFLKQFGIIDPGFLRFYIQPIRNGTILFDCFIVYFFSVLHKINVYKRNNIIFICYYFFRTWFRNFLPIIHEINSHKSDGIPRHFHSIRNAFTLSCNIKIRDFHIEKSITFF